jgi:DHA1 family tetracycline resistance protein-like MFS transporter
MSAQDTAPSPPPSMFRAFVPILMAVTLDLVGFGIVIPLLTFYAEDYSASAIEVTLLMAVYSLAQFLMAPVWGALSDRIGRRPVMLISLTGAALCLAGFAAATTLPMLFLFRSLHGAAAANIATAQACVADLSTPENRAKGMGLIGAAFGFGFTVGPFIGGELSRFGLSTPIWVAAGLSVINLALAFWWLPETRKPSTKRVQRTIDPTSLFRVVRHPVVGLCILLTFIMTIAFAIMESSFTLFAEHMHGLSPSMVGRMFGAAGLTMIVIQGGLIGRLVKRFGEAALVPVGVGILAIGLALLPLAPPPGMMVAVFVLIAIGQGIASPSLHSLISRGASEDEQGLVLGTNQSLSALARAMGPSVSGLLFTTAMALPFYASAAILGACVLLARAAVRQGTQNRESAALNL